MFRWIALAITVFCVLLTDITSLSAFRGVLMPLTAFVMAFVTVMAFAANRIQEGARPQVYMPTAEELEAIRRKREELEKNKPAAGNTAVSGSARSASRN